MGVFDGDVERFGGLASQHAAHRFDGARNHDGNPLAQFAAHSRNSQQRGFDVACVLAGLHQQYVRAAFDQRL